MSASEKLSLRELAQLRATDKIRPKQKSEEKGKRKKSKEKKSAPQVGPLQRYMGRQVCQAIPRCLCEKRLAIRKHHDRSAAFELAAENRKEYLLNLRSYIKNGIPGVGSVISISAINNKMARATDVNNLVKTKLEE